MDKSCLTAESEPAKPVPFDKAQAGPEAQRIFQVAVEINALRLTRSPLFGGNLRLYACSDGQRRKRKGELFASCGVVSCRNSTALCHMSSAQRFLGGFIKWSERILWLYSSRAPATSRGVRITRASGSLQRLRRVSVKKTPHTVYASDKNGNKDADKQHIRISHIISWIESKLFPDWKREEIE